MIPDDQIWLMAVAYVGDNMRSSVRRSGVKWTIRKDAPFDDLPDAYAMARSMGLVEESHFWEWADEAGLVIKRKEKRDE